uniref:LAGLIDADG homing endonuclease n=1 Tax=Pyrrhoderma lamaoense TaxID=2282106 RepID=A0A5B9RCV0_9AGAM|nr:LAGLIDADG homing endonuclease [Phellinus lamaoensis]QEG57139.1 LAGLIDADG homing endonuclease [Phellinus lamaoensis]
MGFITLPYAGTTSLSSFKYSILKDTVTKLKQRSLSAGNLVLKTMGTSETLRNGAAVENIKPVSVHVPRHLKPVTDDQFGHYLAGLIDGDGHFSSKQQLVIVFHSSDVSLAFYIKKYLGFGSIKRVKNKNAFLLVIASKKGLERVINLINGKIRTENKYNQIINNILNNDKFVEIRKNISFKLNSQDPSGACNFTNHWLAGFTDADGSFQIKVLNRNTKVEIRLNFQIDQKRDSILLLIKDFLGGNIGYRKSQDTYYYGSTSFGSAKKVINYFDKFHLLSSKHINYLKWRKAYLIIQNKDHLNKDGIEKIINLKNTMNRLSDTAVQDKVLTRMLILEC